eukprot:scaffold18043_cov46-Attheya_sp.AAC.3
MNRNSAKVYLEMFCIRGTDRVKQELNELDINFEKTMKYYDDHFGMPENVEAGARLKKEEEERITAHARLKKQLWKFLIGFIMPLMVGIILYHNTDGNTDIIDGWRAGSDSLLLLFEWKGRTHLNVITRLPAGAKHRARHTDSEDVIELLGRDSSSHSSNDVPCHLSIPVYETSPEQFTKHRSAPECHSDSSVSNSD